MRNFRKFLTLATVSFLGAIGAANAGEWGTSYGAMTLPDEPTPGAVRAPYSVDQGRVIGRIAKAKCPDCGVGLSGVWVEAGSNEACSTEKDGSVHWGDVHLEFNAAYTAFTGSWNYCGAGGSHPWTGKLGATKSGGQNR